MGALILTRKSGQCVRLEFAPGSYLTLMVAYVGSNQVKLELTGGELDFSQRVDVGASLSLGDDIDIKVVSITFKTVKFRFDAPLSVKIMRTELLERA